LYGWSSNAFNQVIEKDLDRLMDRTKITSPQMSTTVVYCCEFVNHYWFGIIVYDQPQNKGCLPFLLVVYTPLKT
jgi:hypothetical protein